MQIGLCTVLGVQRDPLCTYFLSRDFCCIDADHEIQGPANRNCPGGSQLQFHGGELQSMVESYNLPCMPIRHPISPLSCDLFPSPTKLRGQAFSKHMKPSLAFAHSVRRSSSHTLLSPQLPEASSFSYWRMSSVLSHIPDCSLAHTYTFLTTNLCVILCSNFICLPVHPCPTPVVGE